MGADVTKIESRGGDLARSFGPYVDGTSYYFAAINRIGEERSYRFIGRSIICDVHGRAIAQAGAEEETILRATIDLEEARQKRIDRRQGHWIDRFADRRPELYGGISEER